MPFTILITWIQVTLIEELGLNRTNEPCDNDKMYMATGIKNWWYDTGDTILMTNEEVGVIAWYYKQSHHKKK